jgi:hypothetical protein
MDMFRRNSIVMRQKFDSPTLRARRARIVDLFKIFRGAKNLKKPVHRIHVMRHSAFVI